MSFQITLFLLITLLLPYPIQSGSFTRPTTMDAIQQSIANKDEYSDYAFNIIPDTQIPIGGTLEITFPSQFALGLGIVMDPTLSSYCNMICGIGNSIITFQISTPCLPGVISTFILYGVLNPSYKGGTGNFILRSRKGVNILDENLIYGIVGIADGIQNLTSSTVALDSSGTSAAGSLTKYSFSFKTNQVINWNSFFMITIPSGSGFTISTNPSCSAFSINGNIISGTLVCTSKNNNIIVTGLAADIPAAFDVGITVSLTNPTVSGTTGTFQIAIFRTNTNVIYAWSTGIKGVTITPGALDKVTFSLIDTTLIASKSKVLDYRLQFIPKNSLPLYSQISIQFPMTNIVNYYIEYGIQDIDENTATLVAISTNTMLISGYQAMDNPGEISITIRLQNPNQAGITSPVKIYTYKDSSQAIIDEDMTTATATIVNYQSSLVYLPSVSITSASGSFADGTVANFNFPITPSVSVPTKGWIQIVVPSAFSVGSITSTSCMITGTLYASSCSKKDQVILMSLDSATTYNMNSAYTFSLQNLISKPITAGNYLFDVTTYYSDGLTILDSYSLLAPITSNPLTTTAFTIVGRTTLQGILRVDFTTLVAIPAGVAQTSVTDIKGVIQLAFSAPWANDLGTGLTDNSAIPCYASHGILPVKGLTMGCYLRVSTTASIEIRNFQALSAATVCRVYFANLNIQSGQVALNLIKRYNRVNNILNSASATPSTSVAAVSIQQYSNLMNFSNLVVSEIFDVTWPLTFAQNVAVGDFLYIRLPTYDVGFLQDSSMVTCFVGPNAGPLVAYECIKFPGVDWILIIMSDAYLSSVSLTIYLHNLKWPRYVYNIASPAPLYMWHYNGITEMQYIKYGIFSLPSPKSFYSASMNVPKKGKGYPDCAYYFSFKALNSIPDGGTVVLTFPPDYSLQLSFPSPTFSADQFTGYNGNPLIFTPSANILTISNIAQFPAQSLFTIKVKGLQNPTPTTATSSPWSIQTSYNGYIINQLNSFDFFQYGNSYNPGTIIFNSVEAFPQNALVLAQYTIEFTPNTAIPALGIISITFPPAQFNNLPQTPLCKISGGLQTFSSCVLSGTTITIVTDAIYTTGSLIFTIDDIPNPEAGTTDGFEIHTFYDNHFLDTTDTTDDSYRTIPILPAANPMTVNSIDFEPRNEGELAKYTFSLNPTSNLYNNMELMIRFPDSYDDLIGVGVTCEGLTGIVGGFTVSIVAKKVFITGLDTYIPSNDNPLIITISNVVNPNRISSLGQFRIASFYANTQSFIDYNEDIEGLEVVGAAGWLTIYNISASDYSARLLADYSINFTLSETLPSASSQGYVLINYPTQFDIPDKSITCTSLPITFGNMTGYTLNNRIYSYGNTNTYIGNLFMVFGGIDNPPLSGTTDDLTIMTYDGFNKRIIERSFPNLDRFSFIYSYSGPLITVNGDNDIIVEKGTQTKDLYITIEYPCAVNLTFNTTVTSFSLSPSQIYMNRGDLQSTFRVSVPVSLSEGTYYIIWGFYGDGNDLYTPLKKTKVVVTNLKNVPIDITDIANIPFGGSSLTITASTVYSPNIGIELVANLDSDYPGVSLSRKNIIFASGDNSHSFEVIYSNVSITNSQMISKGGISIILSGVNKDTYTLTTSHLDFVIIAADVNAPSLTELVVSNMGQTFCSIDIGSNEIVLAYYMVALTGTTAPTFTEVYNQGPIDYKETQKQYGMVYIGISNRITITVYKLYAQTPYTIYVFLKNRGENINSIKTLDFVTSNRDPAAEFTLSFLQSYLNSAEISNIMNQTAFILSLPIYHIQQKIYTFTSRVLDDNDFKDLNCSRSLTSTQTTSSLLTLQVFSITNSSNYPTPLNMANLLRNKTVQLNSLLTNFDTSYYIPTKVFVSYIPSFVETPTVPVVDQFYITIQAKLDNYGFVYAIALNASQDQSKPSAFQVYNGFNSMNLPCASGSIEISEAFTYFTFSIYNLSANTQYNVYITGGSVQPGYPDLMSDKSIVLVGVLTKPLIIWDPLNINFGMKRENVRIIMWFLMIVLLILVVF